MKTMLLSLKNKLAASHLAAIFITAAFLGIGSYNLLVKFNRQATFTHLRTTADHASVFLETFLSEREDHLIRMMESRDVQEFSTTYRELALAHYLRQFTADFSAISYISPNGREELRMAGSVLNKEARDFSKNSLFRNAIANAGRICYQEDAILPPRRVLTMALAAKARFGSEVDNVLMVEIPLANLEKLLNRYLRNDEFIVVHDALGRVLLHPDATLLGQTTIPVFTGQGFSKKNRLGENAYYASADIPRLRWTLVTALPEVVYDTYPHQLRTRAFLAFLLTCLIGGAIAHLVSRKLSAPLLSLINSTRHISEGKSTQPIDVATNDEIGLLVQSFNRMIATLRETTVSRDYMDNILQSFHECLLVVNEDGIIEAANRMTYQLLGFAENELIGKEIGTVLPASVAEKFNDQQHQVLEEETELLAKNGEIIAVLFSRSFLRDKDNTLIGTVCLAQDIRERKADEQEKARLHTQLQQAQRLETIGTLAGGIAHDFNNILTAIIGFSQLAKRMAPEDNPARQALENSLAASFRAKDLVKQLLSFSRQGSQHKASLNIASVVKEIVKLLGATIPPTIDIRQQIDPACYPVYADPAQIHQLILNLCTNAVQAMADKGTLKISIENVFLDTRDCHLGQDLKPGNYVRLQVRDTGQGIAPEILHRIFDPFFTTKDIDHGSGLGLAVSHGIVKSHQGDIRVNSKLGHGTTFTIHLPAYAMEESDKKEKEMEEKVAGRGERVLFVDDEEALTQLAEHSLTRYGFRVTAVPSSEQALELFRAAPSSFDLVVTDYAMPKLDGGQLIARMLSLRPDIPLLLCTGYSEDISLRENLQDSVRRIVLKPYTPEELASHIRQVLDTVG